MSLLVTPFSNQGSIDWKGYEKLVDWQIAKKPNGLFAVCGSSEMQWLTLQERLKLATIAVHRAGTLPVVATANMELDWTVHGDELKRMTETGVSGIILVPPVGLAADQDRLEAYFAKLAEQADVPVFLYEYPGSNPGTISDKVYGNLVRNCRIRGIKDTTCTLEGILAKIEAAPDSIVYQANTAFMLDALKMGARGIMAITSAACTELVVALWDKVQMQDCTASTAHQMLVFLDAVLNGGFTATAKYLLKRQGLDIEVYTRSQAKLQPHTVRALEAWHEQFTSLQKRALL